MLIKAIVQSSNRGSKGGGPKRRKRQKACHRKGRIVQDPAKVGGVAKRTKEKKKKGREKVGPRNVRRVREHQREKKILGLTR